MYNKHSIHPFASQPSRSANSPKRIIVALNAEIYDFDSSFILPGLVIPHGALSEQQLTTLKEDVSALQDLLYEDKHFHTPHLRLDTEEDVKVLRLICDHSYRDKRLRHLRHFLYFRQHGIYVSEWVTQQSLLATRQAAFMIKTDSDLPYGLLPDFNYYICEYPVVPHTLENLHLLAKRHPNVEISHRAVCDVFMYLSHEQQKGMIGYTSHQIKAIMDCDWYIHHANLSSLHLERVKKNLPLVEHQFVMQFESKGKISSIQQLAHAMTLDEAEDFQKILDRTQFIIPNSYYSMSTSSVFGLFVYLYLELGSTNFEELLYYLKDCESNNRRKRSLVKVLYDYYEAQERIIVASKQHCELPLSLRLTFSGFDWNPYMEQSCALQYEF